MKKQELCCFCAEPLDSDEPRMKQVAGEEEHIGAAAHPNCFLGEPHGVNEWEFIMPKQSSVQDKE